MLRKTYAIGILFSLFSSSGFCSPFYIGAGIGPEEADFQQKAHFVQGTNANVIDKTHDSGLGVFGTLFGGYAYAHKRFYLAGELNADASSVEFTSSNSEFVHRTFSSTHYKMNRSFGVSLLPGFLFSELTLFYGRLGYANGNFSVSTSDASLKNMNTNLSGFRFGAGIRQIITEKLAVRLEYSQVNYQTASMFVVIPPNITKSTKITPQTAQVEFGLIYNFA